MIRIFQFIMIASFSLVSKAENIYVNNLSGSDSNRGREANSAFKTIRKAVSELQSGDTLHLLNTGAPYKESLVLHNVSGTKGARIIIDGHGSMISGVESVDALEWEEVSSGLYKNAVMYAKRKFNVDVIRRYYFLFNGKMNRMGRCLKGNNIPLKDPDDLNDNEWSFIEAEKTFYLKIAPGQSLKSAGIQYPVRSNAVAISGTSSYITIKNIVCTNVYNDGFGITGTANNLKFEQIQSLYCGDDGISAHADSEFTVDGFISIGNGTGICDTGNSITSYNNVIIKGCVGVDLYFLNGKSGNAFHSIRNSTITGNAARTLIFHSERKESTMQVEMEKLSVTYDTQSDRTMRVTGNIQLRINDCLFSDNYDFEK